jgi:hypothetical protein
LSSPIVNEKSIEALTERVSVLTERTIQAMEAIGRLAHIAGNTEHRISPNPA